MKKNVENIIKAWSPFHSTVSALSKYKLVLFHFAIELFLVKEWEYYMILAGIKVCPTRKAAAPNALVILGSKSVL